MSRDREKILREIKNYFKDQDFESEEEYGKAIEEFMKNYNGRDIENQELDAWDYLDMAYEAYNEKDALKYAKKALKMDKDLLDAEVIVTEINSKGMEDLKKKYEALIERTEKSYQEKGLFADQNIGIFWGIIETRPYMRLRHYYARLLMNMGKYRKAIQECEELLDLSTGDNLGMRHFLMGLHAYFEDEFAALKLHKRFDNAESLAMLLPLAAMYYKLDDLSKAKKFMNRAKKLNENLINTLKAINNGDYDSLEEFQERDGYSIGSPEEVLSIVDTTPFLYVSSVGFIKWATS